MLTNRQDDAVIGRELDWQSRVEGDQAKSIAFRDQTVNKTTFRAFTFMKGKSPLVHMAHAVGQCFSMSGLATEVQGKYIGFIGDRGNGRYPVPFILPPQNTWASTKVKHLSDGTAFLRSISWTKQIETTFGQQRRAMTPSRRRVSHASLCCRCSLPNTSRHRGGIASLTASTPTSATILTGTRKSHWHDGSP